jgi:hypothetical protein
MQLNVSVIIPILRNYNNFLEEALNFKCSLKESQRNPKSCETG